MWNKLPLFSVLPTLLLLPYSLGQDPLDICLPRDGDSFICSDRKDYCVNTLDLVFNFENLDNHCNDGYMGFYDPNYACNCAIRCIKALEKGDACQTSFTADYPEELCGNGLECIQDPEGESYICGRNANGKPCVAAIVDYERQQQEGTLGPEKLYPMCDELGQFGPKQCSTSTTCYCTDTDGNRIFGEAVYTEADNMDCECSRYRERNKELGFEGGLRCTGSGNLDNLQCNEDFCYCYNSTTKVMTQGPVPLIVATELDCFIDSYHSVNFTTNCLKEKERYSIPVDTDYDGYVIQVNLTPVCDVDDHHATIQPFGGGYYCSDKNGNRIGDYQFTAVESPFCNCNCATRRNLMTEAGLLEEQPECCPNGNFKKMQKRSLFAYCVDENGNQEGDALALTDIESLPCYADPCPDYS